MFAFKNKNVLTSNPNWSDKKVTEAKERRRDTH
jgi:hypothetical protein